MQMWGLGTQFSGEFVSAGLTIRLDDLKGLFQAKQLYDSMTWGATVQWAFSPWESQGAHLLGAHFFGYMMEKKVIWNTQHGLLKG